jgi:ABC-type lipoprotein export system ATPase subunit
LRPLVPTPFNCGIRELKKYHWCNPTALHPVKTMRSKVQYMGFNIKAIFEGRTFMIRVSNLQYSYSDQKKISFPDFEIVVGSHGLLLGDSGCGKTTLLHLLGGLLHPQQGMVHVGGTDISQLSERELDRFRGQHFGFVFQRNHLIQSLTVQDNLLMAPYLAGRKQDMARVLEVLEKLGLMGKRNSRIQELSQGQAQRVAIARAVMNKPGILLADEPTSGCMSRVRRMPPFWWPHTITD